MITWINDPTILLAGVVLALFQFLAALPWLYAIDPKGFRSTASSGASMAYVGVGLLAAGIAVATFMSYNNDSQKLVWYGRYIYGSILHLQLLIGLFLLLPHVIVMIWPKGGAVAFAAYREGCRQPMFWLITVGAILTTWLSVALPYFTFGDDYKMMKQIGFDVVMLAAVLFGVLAASMSISEEIEGRTAVTLMSKPVNRRQFLIGKFLGILLACLVMSLIVSWNLSFALRAMREFDQINNNPDPTDPIGTPTDKVVDPMTFQAQRTVVPIFEKPVPSIPGKAIARGVRIVVLGCCCPHSWRRTRFRTSDDSGCHRLCTGHPIDVCREHRLVPAHLSDGTPCAYYCPRDGVRVRRRCWCRAGRIPRQSVQCAVARTRILQHGSSNYPRSPARSLAVCNICGNGSRVFAHLYRDRPVRRSPPV